MIRKPAEPSLPRMSHAPPAARRTGWRLASAAVASGIVWFCAGLLGDSPPPSSAAADGPLAGPSLPIASPTIASAERAEEPVAPSVTRSSPCPGQSIALAPAGEAPRPQCASPTSTRRTGEALVHEVRTSGDRPGWTLRIEAVGSHAQRVTLTDAEGLRYGCETVDGGCAGALLGEPDSLDARPIVLDGVRLDALPLSRPRGMRIADMTPSMFAADPSVPPIVVSARLRTQSGASADPPCEGPAVTLVSSNGKVGSFCGAAGSEYAERRDGGTQVGFLAYEGPPLRVRIDAQQRVARIEMGPLVCEGAACTGAVVETAAPTETQTQTPGLLAFSGTTLMRAGDAGSSESVVLDGRLAMPEH